MEPNMYSEEQLATKYLREAKKGVLATASLQGEPYMKSTKYALDTEDGFYFCASQHNKVYANLNSNPNASFAIVQDAICIHITGVAVELEGAEIEDAKRRLNERQGLVKEELGKLMYFKFMPIKKEAKIQGVR